MFVPWLTVMPRPATKSSSSSWVMPLMTGTPRRHAAVWSGQLTLWANFSPDASTGAGRDDGGRDADRRHREQRSPPNAPRTCCLHASPLPGPVGTAFGLVLRFGIAGHR